MTTAVAEGRLAALEAKLDAVSHQLDYVAAALREQEVRRNQWDDLRRDLAPISTEAMEVVSRELDEVRGFIEPRDLLRFLKRLLRDLPNLEALLDQIESLSQLGSDVAPLGRDILMAAMGRLDAFERRGYFAFARGLLAVGDHLASAVGEEDWQAIARSTPSAIGAVKGLAPAVARAWGEAPAEAPGLFRLMWRLRRPAARRGLARALGLLEALGAPSVSPTAPAND